MKKTVIWLSLLMVCALQFSTVIQAQEDPKPKKFDNPQWKRISLTSYKNGQFARAKEIIRNYHMKASEKAGTPRPEMIIDLVSGEWDVMTIWNMPEGLGEFDWETSPRDIKWRKAFNEIAGGADKATAILNEFSALVVRSSRYIGRIRQ